MFSYLENKQLSSLIAYNQFEVSITTYVTEAYSILSNSPLYLLKQMCEEEIISQALPRGSNGQQK